MDQELRIERRLLAGIPSRQWRCPVPAAAQAAWFNTPLVDHLQKVVPPVNLGDWERLRAFGERMTTEARSAHAICVVFAGPRKFKSWAYTDAHERAALLTAAGLSLHAAGIKMVCLHQATAASKLGFGNKIAAMDEGLPARLGIDPGQVAHWIDRRPAFAVAAAALEQWA